MGHFRGDISAGGSTASRMGKKDANVRVRAMSYQGNIEVTMWHDFKTGLDMVEVTAKQHATDHFNKAERLMYRGPIREARAEVVTNA